MCLVGFHAAKTGLVRQMRLIQAHAQEWMLLNNCNRTKELLNVVSEKDTNIHSEWEQSESECKLVLSLAPYICRCSAGREYFRVVTIHTALNSVIEVCSLCAYTTHNRWLPLPTHPEFVSSLLIFSIDKEVAETLRGCGVPRQGDENASAEFQWNVVKSQHVTWLSFKRTFLSSCWIASSHSLSLQTRGPDPGKR